MNRFFGTNKYHISSPVWLFPNCFNTHISFFSISTGFHTSGDQDSSLAPHFTSALSCLSSPRLLYGPGNISQPKHNSSRATGLTASFEFLQQTSKFQLSRYIQRWQTSGLPQLYFLEYTDLISSCDFFTSIVSTSIPFMVSMVLREEN